MGTSIEDIIGEARNGRMFILEDDVGNDGRLALIIPAQMATPDKVNYMARHARGLICLALTEQRVAQLGLQFQSPDRKPTDPKAFTVSIEARDGISTGISAADRARTIAVAIDAATQPEQIVSPGHVFPLVAQPGGCLDRASPTEAAVDISRLAGLNPSAVLCAMLSSDGDMARREDIATFAEENGLKIGRIGQLIEYRRKHDSNVRRVAEVKFQSARGGEWTAVTYENKATQAQTMAFVKGAVKPGDPTLVRMHAFSVFADVMDEIGPRRGLLQASMDAIVERGDGIIVILNKPVRNALQLEVEGRKALPGSGDSAEVRDYGVGAQILADLGVTDMVLLSNTPHNTATLAGFGLTIVGQEPITPAKP